MELFLLGLYFSHVPLSQESEVYSSSWGGQIAFPSAGSGALTSVKMFSAVLPRSRTQMEEG